MLVPSDGRSSGETPYKSPSIRRAPVTAPINPTKRPMPRILTLSIKHSGFNRDSVIEASFKVLTAVPHIMNKVQPFQDRILTDAEQLALYRLRKALVEFRRVKPRRSVERARGRARPRTCRHADYNALTGGRTFLSRQICRG